MADEQPPMWPRGWLRTSAVLLPLVICLALSAGRDTVSNATDVLILVTIVVGAAAAGDRWAGMLAALSSALWFDFFLTQPYLRFAITSPSDIGDTVLLLVIGAVVTELALWGHRQASRASGRAGYLEGALSTAELVLGRHESVASLTGMVSDQLIEVLGIETCRFVTGDNRDDSMAVLQHDGSVTRHGHPLNIDRGGLPTDTETVLLVRRNHGVLGHFVLTSAGAVARPTAEQRRVAVLLADQVASLLGDRPV